MNNTVYSNSYAGIYLFSWCSNNIIYNNSVYLNGVFGIYVGHSDLNTIANNSIYSNDKGLVLSGANSNTIINNSIHSNGPAVSLPISSNSNSIVNNYIVNNSYGITLGDSSSNNIIESNTCSLNTWEGIKLDLSSNNIIVNNTCSFNKVGISISYSTDNKVYHNNILHNTNQALDTSNHGNQWDNGYPSGGNFWSDYTGADLYKGPSQNITGSDGIGDTPYIIDSDSQDNYPLMKRIGPNTKPTVSFTFTPSSGNISTIFYFDASACSDNEDITLDLRVRWDWGDDGIWDTVWTTTKTANHQYSSPGTYMVRLEVMDSGGLMDNITQQVVVQDDGAPPGDIKETKILNKSEVILGIAAVVAAALASMVLGTTDVGKYGFLLFFLPLYTRLNKEDVLDHETRGRIRGMIELDPGIRYSELKKKLRVKNGTLTYHLRVLEREGYIQSKNNGVSKHFFPGNMKLPKNIIRMRGVQKIVFKEILENPGISQRKIAQLIGGSTSTVNYNINIMAKKGIIELRRKGNETKCYIIEEN